MRRRLCVAVVALVLPHASLAQNWVWLGGTDRMRSELDTSSIQSHESGASAWIRSIGITPQGQLTVHQLLVAHCGRNMIEVERGIIEADWSPRVVETPDLPPQDRFLPLLENSEPNHSFSNLYAYLCR